MSTATIGGDEVVLKNYIDNQQLQTDLHIDVANINQDLARHAGLYIEYGRRAVMARSQSDRFKTSFEILESQLDHHYRVTLKEENPKVTEPAIRAAIVNDPRWKAANQTMIAASTIFRLAEKAERAMDDRKDMLLQIARNLAKEQEGALRVTVNQDSRQRMLDAMARANAATPVAAD